MAIAGILHLRRCYQVMGIPKYYYISESEGYGFDGIAISLITSSNLSDISELIFGY